MEVIRIRWCDILLTLNLFLVLFLSHSSGEENGYKYVFNGRAVDDTIESEYYPKSYPRDVNVTWEWTVKSGLWGVVFKDFDLDKEQESVLRYDWLEVDDKNGKTVRYTKANPPVLHFKSVGPELIVRFVSDSKSDPNSRGFQLYVLYGRNDSEVEIKIHEATKEKHKDKEDGSDYFLITVITLLIVIIIFAIIACVFFLRRCQSMSPTHNRNAFGVRRNSGISHSRRPADRSQNDGAPIVDGEQHPHQQQQQHRQQRQERQQQQQQQPQAQREVGRPVQRSNSQLNWMERAELHTTIQTAGRVPRPNIYTPTSPTTADSRDTVAKHIRNVMNVSSDAGAHDHRFHHDDVTAAAAAAAFQRSVSTNDSSRPPAVVDHLSACHSMPDNLGAGDDSADASVVSSIPRLNAASSNLPAITFSSCKTTGQLTNHVTYSRGGPGAQRGSLDEYCETADSLNREGRGGSISVSTWSSDSHPPSYDEAYLSLLPPAYGKRGVAVSQACYENIPVSSGEPSTRQWIGSQTNIYINAGGLASGSTHSLKRITIDSGNVISPTPGVSQEAINSIMISKSSANQKEDNKMDTRTSTNHKGAQGEGGALSSVKDVDGYAYLIPASNQVEDKPRSAEPRATPEVNNDWRMSQTPPTSQSIFDVDGASMPWEEGYVKMQMVNNSAPEGKLYVNLSNE